MIGHEPTVLVVDDEHDTAELFRDTLRTLTTEVRRHLGPQAPENRRASL